jgi:asparagine synthase (glutamine-hydrolysing)
MCGILCVLNAFRGGEHILPRVLERVRRLRHRGPDWSGVRVYKNSVLAHERLAIVDVEHGSQPLRNEASNVWLAVNGEIYNHKKLKTELTQAATFLTDSDCEPILHLYEENQDTPEKFLNKLNGIFAFVLNDERNDRFLAARDHMGIIPLYMGRDADGAIWFSSELKAIHDICVSFEDFPPGHYYDSKVGKLVRWYAPQWHDETILSENALDLTKLREGLESAVRRQLMSDVPYGVLLSGGLDSSVIAAITAKICANRVEAEGRSPAWWPRLHSFSVGLKESPDLKAARVVADELKTVHHEFTFTVDEGINALHDVIFHLETYDVTTIRAATPMYLMARKIKCLGVKMVLSGEGSDEMFGGYLYFHKCPDRVELHKELVRKLKGLYKFDCLRANKATAAWGVEARVPFLDREFLDYVMNDINPQDKLCGRAVGGRIEKHILREAFKGYLPESILWRQKEQFSDGVGYSWIDTLKAHAEKKVTDLEFANAQFRFPHNTPATKEAYYFRSVFESHFPHQCAREAVPGGPSIACSTPAALLWDASFKAFADCSGRSVAGVHEAAYDATRREQAKGEQVDDAVLAKVTAGTPATPSSPTVQQ